MLQLGERFVDELNWCINQLELGLQRQSPDSRQTQESLKILKILKSTKAPMVKKRQAMRSALGDYRKKMKDEEKKSLNAMKHSQFKSTHNKKFFGKSRFIRHSHTREVVFEQENEENRVLSMNLNSLNLDQQSSSNDRLCSSSTLPSSQTEVPNSSQVCGAADNNVEFQPFSGQCINIKGDQGMSSITDSVLPAGEAGAANKILCSGDDNKFKFDPSDNSFAFNFKDDRNALNKEVKDDAKTLTTANGLEGDQCATNSVKVDKFKYEKSDNSFSFNFGL